MKRTFSSDTYHFLLASLLSASAQSFFLATHRYSDLLRGISSLGVVVLSALFFSSNTLSLSLVFFTGSKRRQKQIWFFVFIALAFHILLYARALQFVEAILFFVLCVGYSLKIWQRNAAKNYLAYAMIIANTAVGAGFILIPGFLDTPVYQLALLAKFPIGLTFIGTATIKLLSLLRPEREFYYKLSKLIVLPWLGWAFIFAKIPELSIVVPSVVLSATLLTSSLLPFEKVRLPENRMFGNIVFPTVSLLHVLFLALVYYLIQGSVPSITEKNDVALFSSYLLSLVLLYSVMKSHSMIYKLTSDPTEELDEHEKKTNFERFSDRLFAPAQELLPLSEWQAKKIQGLSDILSKEKESARQFTMLGELRKELNDQYDDPVAAQLVVNSIVRYFRVGIAAVFLYDIESQEVVVLASAGEMKASVSSGYRQKISRGIIGRTARLRKTQISNDTEKDQEYIEFPGAVILSEIDIPLINHGHLKGILTVGSKEKNTFSAADVRTLEAIGEELLSNWDRSGYNRRLGTLIQSNIPLSTALNTQAVIEEVAKLTRKTVEARFVFAALFNQDGSFTRTSSVGYAPSLHEFLSRDLSTNKLLEAALDAKKPFRVRDIRKYRHAPSVTLDHNMLRGLIVMPLRLHGVNIGAILGFGKQGGVFFNKKDESLANLLATQAVAAIESSWLIDELRSRSVTTSILNELSYGILETENIQEAAQLIAKSAHRLATASVAGIVLYSSLDRKVQIALEVSSEGIHLNQTVPLEFVKQTLATGERITVASGDGSAHIYLPIQTSLRKYGVLWVEFEEGERQASSQEQYLQTLANQAAMALERTMFLLDSREKAEEIKDAYRKLKTSYDETLTALMAALDARDRETEGHSERVGKVAYLLGENFNLTELQRNSLQRGSLLHDIGKIGISDVILNKVGVLTEEEWEIMRKHPVIGREIIKDIPFLQDALPVVYCHHERWNGSGYPQGLRGEEIPLEARIFAVADIFDALTSIRSYRKKSTEAEALAYLKEQAGILVDPQVVEVFERLLKRGSIHSVTEPKK
jgi:HD-GYP domain-containing protein (c-di-GMP phosphodiesterase class II)/putative methionine-R-sulfoxide reductase with GAF domain